MLARLSDFIRNWASYDAYLCDARGVRRPFLLRVFYLVGIVTVLIAGIFSIAAPFNLGEYYTNGRTLTGHEFLATGGALTLLAIAIFGSILARDLRWGRPRARLLLLGLWAAGLTAWRPTMTDASSNLVQYLFIGLVFWWYLFRKASSRAYFTDVTDGQTGSSAA